MSTLRCAGAPSSSIAARAPLAGERAVVDQRHERRRDLLADPATEHRRVLRRRGRPRGRARRPRGRGRRRRRASARPAACRTAPGRARSIVSARRAAVRATSSGSTSSKSSKPTVRPGCLHARLHAGVADRDALDEEPGAHLVVLGEQPVGVGDEDAPARVGVRHADLADRDRPRPGRRRRPGARSSTLRAFSTDSGSTCTSCGRRHGTPFEQRRPCVPAGRARGSPPPRLRPPRAGAPRRGRRCARTRSSRRARRGCRRRARGRTSAPRPCRRRGAPRTARRSSAKTSAKSPPRAQGGVQRAFEDAFVDHRHPSIAVGSRTVTATLRRCPWSPDSWQPRR